MVAMGGVKSAGSVVLVALFAILLSVNGQGALVKAPVAPVKAPVAPVKAPVAPVKAPVAPVKAPVAPVKAPAAGPGHGLARAPAPVPLPPMMFSPAPEPAPLWPPCEGVDLVYITSLTQKIYPYLNDTPWIQPYKFEANVIITNMGYSTVEGWEFGINFTHGEILVDASGMALADGRVMPVDVSNGTILTQVPDGVLKNAIETAGDTTQIQKVFTITGTEFGMKKDPMPLNINITQKGYNCSRGEIFNNNTMHSCCLEPDRNVTLTDGEVTLPSEKGNFTITYDVTQAYPGSYMALVTISNDSPIIKLDSWNLSWTWQENEFITKMMGATTTEADLEVCLNGIAGKTYTNPDLNTVFSCSTSPEVIDLPLDRTNDTTIGGIKYCCRNGTIWPEVIDSSKSKSAFLMNVFKVPPTNMHLNSITPPGNWRFGEVGRFKCGKPRRIKPTAYPDPYLLHETTAFKTWQVTCNQTAAKRPPKCCVSFSKYTNDSIVPCRTCACGCPATPDPAQPVCSATAPAMLLPYSAIAMNPENRTKQILAWASLNHQVAPNPLPCMDHCGVAINWHVVSNFTRGWSSRMTLFDWSNTTFPDWFTVLEMPGAFQGFEQAYSFNATKMPLMNDTTANTTILVQGREGLNYLMAAANRSAGKLQSVFSFTKQETPGILEQDYFPSSIWFNGEECAMPEGYPMSGVMTTRPSFVMGLVVSLVVVVLFGPVF